MNIGPGHIWIVIAVVAALFGATKVFAPTSSPLNAETAAIIVGNEGENKVVLIKRPDCVARKDRVWVVANERGECIAFVASGEDVASETAVLFFEGDMSDDAGTAVEAPLIESYKRRTKKLAETYAVPFFVIGRPGVIGSSGSHLIGGLKAEAEIMTAAVDALRQRFAIRRLVLAGQSGGSRIAAQLLARGRRDVACAAMGSGAYGLPSLVGGGTVTTNIFGDAPRRFFIPLQNVEGVAADQRRRVFVIGDPQDSRTPYPEQSAWAEKLQAAGHHAVLLIATGSGDEHHGMTSLTLEVAGLCASGKSDAEIKEFVKGYKGYVLGVGD